MHVTTYGQEFYSYWFNILTLEVNVCGVKVQREFQLWATKLCRYIHALVLLGVTRIYLVVYWESIYLMHLTNYVKMSGLLVIKCFKFLFETVDRSNWIVVKISSLECINLPDLDTLQLHTCIQFLIVKAGHPCTY